MRELKTCNFCVLDSSFSGLLFNEEGQCHSCLDARKRLPLEWLPNEEGRRRLHASIERIKSSGSHPIYDCLIGLSGGVDSAYLAHLAVKEFGLRVLAVHVDGGWNSTSAVSNIESIVRKLDIDLVTEVVEWEEMKDLQRSYLKASVVNQDIPQDHIFFSTLYRTAIKYRIRHFLSGVNFPTESINIPNWGHPSMDGRQLSHIQKKFGKVRLKNYRPMPLLEFIWHSRIGNNIEIHKPLNYLNYNKKEAISLLVEKYDWIEYGEKHSESRFTKFHQEHYLPRKVGVDKRKIHLSSLIVSGQLTREEALQELSSPISSAQSMMSELRYIAKKLDLDRKELDQILSEPVIRHSEYPNDLYLYRIMVRIKKMLGRGTGET